MALAHLRGELCELLLSDRLAQRAHLLRRLGEEPRACELLRDKSLPPTAARTTPILAAAAAASGAPTRAAVRAADAAVGQGGPLGAVALPR